MKAAAEQRAGPDKPTDAPWVSMAGPTTAKRNEIGELRHLEKNCVREDHSGNRFLKVPMGKMNNERLVPLDPETLAAVTELQRQGREGSPWLIEGARERPVGAQTYQDTLVKLAGDISLALPDKLTTHRLRHTFATALMNGGMSLTGVMKLLGHRGEEGHIVSIMTPIGLFSGGPDPKIRELGYPYSPSVRVLPMRVLGGLGWIVVVSALWACGSEEVVFEPNEPEDLGTEVAALTGGPTAVLTGGPSSGAAPLAVYLDGTTSKPAADGSWISQCRLDWGDGASTTSCYGRHSYAAGSWTARFTVTDNKGRTGVATKAITATGPTSTGVYQPGYHAALRWSYSVSSLTTFRMRIPMVRAGSKIRVSLDAGDRGATLNRTTVALASGSTGNTTGMPIALTFGGRSGLSLGARARITSDPVSLNVSRGTELYVSFEVTGSLAASAINLLPGSYMRTGSYATVSSGFGGAQRQLPTGVTTIDVLGAQERVYITLGDSITEGYTSGSDNYRSSWPFIAANRSGRAVVPAAVSGSGILETLSNLQTEVLSVDGITDCTVLIGTNNLHSFTPSALEAKLTELYGRLKPKCRVWAMPITPREKTSVPGASLTELQARRREVNSWIRGLTGSYAILDLDGVVRDPNNTDKFRTGYGEDGVHPTVLANQKMGEYAATQF